MAKRDLARKENVSGDFFVDSTCIDCDTCRWIAPEVFHKAGEMSAVFAQPQTATQELEAAQALISCPTASIGYLGPSKGILKQAIATYPLVIEDNVYHCGFHAENTFGGTSYFIHKSNMGNILVDSPRFTPSLVNKFEAMGGIDYMYLTHKDDIGDHQLFYEHFGCQRIIHAGELCPSIPKAEVLIEQSHPLSLDEEGELVIIPTPGHSQGHTVLLYRNKYLFSGDHMAYSAKTNKLNAFRDYCWYSWDKQIESIEKLLKYNFEWLLPCHGRRIKAPAGAFKAHIETLVNWMQVSK